MLFTHPIVSIPATIAITSAATPAIITIPVITAINNENVATVTERKRIHDVNTGFDSTIRKKW